MLRSQVVVEHIQLEVVADNHSLEEVHHSRRMDLLPAAVAVGLLVLVQEQLVPVQGLEQVPLGLVLEQELVQALGQQLALVRHP